MATEIERKFLVRGDAWRQPDAERIVQGYLNRDKERTVRVRVAGSKAFITVKGIPQGACRMEFEYPVLVRDAEHMMAMCDGPIIEKMRHYIEIGDVTWEVDEFLGENAGLVVAEVELVAEDQKIELPSWVGQEVTDDSRYFNSSLSENPYSRWSR